MDTKTLVQDFWQEEKMMILSLWGVVLLWHWYATLHIILSGVTLCVLRYWFKGGKCRSTARLNGKTVIITGANTGIGKETAQDLSKRGARVIMACRDIQKAEAAATDIRMETGEQVLVKKLDLASLRSVRDFADDIIATEDKIHVLINNAGVMMCPYWKTEDGFEMQFGTNHLGHFLLTSLLLDTLKKSAPARIITVSSIAHKFGNMDFDNLQSEKSYSKWVAYGRSKLANILFTRELASRLQGTGVNCYVVHPGAVRTEVGRHMAPQSVSKVFQFLSSPLVKTPLQGAQTSIFCVVDESLQGESGKYYSDCQEATPSALGRNDDVAKRLWDVSTKLVNLK